MKEVRAVSYTTGEYDVILEAVLPSDDDLLRLLTSRLAKTEGIRTMATSHVL